MVCLHATTCTDCTLLTKNDTREIVQSYIPVWAFKILNLTFISFMQSVILYLLAAPAYPILLSTQFRSEVDTSDLAFVSFQLALITTEWFADQQQWGESIQMGVQRSELEPEHRT